MVCYPIAVVTLVALVFTHPQPLILSKRVLLILSTIYLLRAICICVTVLPCPDPTCEISPSTGSSFHDALQVMVWLRDTCSDVFFSAHASVLTVSTLFVRDYVVDILDENLCRLAWLSSWVLTATGCLIILMTHKGYTIDVIVGVGVAIAVHDHYHSSLSVKNGEWLEEGEDQLTPFM